MLAVEFQIALSSNQSNHSCLKFKLHATMVRLTILHFCTNQFIKRLMRNELFTFTFYLDDSRGSPLVPSRINRVQSTTKTLGTLWCSLPENVCIHPPSLNKEATPSPHGHNRKILYHQTNWFQLFLGSLCHHLGKRQPYQDDYDFENSSVTEFHYINH